jgi:dipeptidyl aminopeptidase/acylaminoacyl peptidase
VTDPAVLDRRRRIARAVFAVAWRVTAFYAAVQLVTAILLLTNFKRDDVPLPDPLRTVARKHGGFDRVEFFSADRVGLRGEILGGTQRGPVVVFGHGYRHRRRQGDELAKELLERGYSVCLFDFRGSGASDGAFTTAGALERRDVLGAVRYLEGQAIARHRIAYVGFSMGAAAGLLAAESLDGIAAAVLVAPYARMVETFEARTLRYSGLPLDPVFLPAMLLFGAATGVDPHDIAPIDHVAAFVKTPLLLIGGDRDWRAPVRDLVEMRRLAGGRPELLILEDADHHRLSRLDGAVCAPIVEFLLRHLPPRPVR